MQSIDITKINRLEVIDDQGRACTVRLGTNGHMGFHVQDEGRTLKVFVTGVAATRA